MSEIRSAEAILAGPTCSVDEACLVTGLPRGTLYAAIKAGEVPVLRVGRRILVSTAWLRAGMEASVG
jgi:excisionase family DNA binding protein